MIPRRSFLQTGLAGVAGLIGAGPLSTVGQSASAAEAEGTSPPRMALGPSDNPVAGPFDREVTGFMEARRVPGGALAVAKDGRLVYACGYGWADRERREPVRPESLFRIASVSKPITGVAIQQLAEQGRLDLDAPAFSLIDIKAAARPKAKTDSRLARITVRQILHHAGGWDRDRSYDPMFRPIEIAKSVGAAAPAGAAAIIQYMMGEPLDFDPGTRYAYSNFGYCVLGRIIERIAGRSYEEHVKQAVLGPCGIRAMRIGATLEEGRASGEVRYYMKSEGKVDSIFPQGPRQVTSPYGGFHLEAMDAHGGWIASAIDLLRLTKALRASEGSPILRRASIERLEEAPAAPVSRKADGTLEPSFYGFGWMIRPQSGKRANCWHSGSLPGTSTLLVRRWDGLDWAVLFNQRSDDGKLSDNEIDGAMHRAAGKVVAWPAHDLFPR